MHSNCLCGRSGWRKGEASAILISLIVSPDTSCRVGHTDVCNWGAASDSFLVKVTPEVIEWA